MSKKRKRQKMSLPRQIVFVIALMVFVGAAGVIIDHYVTGWRAEKALNDLEKYKVEQVADLETEKGTVIGEYVELYKKNPDIIGWIKIEGTNINYPVMHTPGDPEYYLRRDFDQQYSLSGTPFLDGSSDIFLPTCNWTIYGHHMKDGTMFMDVTKYADRDFYEEHKIIEFDTIYKETGQAKYEVMAAFYAEIKNVDEGGFKYYQYAGITTEESFNEYVAGVKSESEYDTGVEAEYGDQLITLSTCNYHVGDGRGRFAVVAKRIDE